MAYSKKTGSYAKASMSRKYGAKTGKRRAAPFGRVSAGLAKAVKAVVARQAEVKYCADEPQSQAIVQQQILLPPSLFSMIPRNSVGTGPASRIGDKIRNAHGYTDFFISLNGNALASHSYAVKLFHLESRSVKDSSFFTPAMASTLLDVGNNTTTDWNPATIDPVVLSQMPVSDSNWICKNSKVVFLSKNDGPINGGPAATPASANGGHGGTVRTVRFYWKHPAPITYETNPTAPNNLLPTNYAPVYATVAWQVDGPYVVPVNSLVLVTTRTHMWYQDA